MPALVLPLLVPFFAAVLMLLARRQARLQTTLGVVGAVAGLGASLWIARRVWQDGLLVTQLGGWPAPFGITLAVDTLSAGLLVATTVVHVAVAAYAAVTLDEERRRGSFWPLSSTMVMGVEGAFMTGDLFNMYVWFEVLLVSSFVLVVLGNRPRQVEATAKYVIINLVASATFLIGLGLLYGATGTLNMADLSVTVAGIEDRRLVAILAVFFFVAFGIKAAAFPLSFWLPSAYHTPIPAVSALFAGLLTKVGVYALIRASTLVFASARADMAPLLATGTVLTLAIGPLGALGRRGLRHVLSYYLIGAIGFMLLGLTVGTEAALSATVFYLLTDMLVIAGLFLLGGAAEHVTGHRDVPNMGGLFTARPLLSTCFVVLGFSVFGFPPLPGFWGKLGLLRAAADADRIGLLLVALVASAGLLVSVGQVWSRAFWRPARDELSPPNGRVAPIVGLAAVLLAVSALPGPLYTLAARAGAELASPSGYVRAVLGEEAPR